MMKNVSLFIVLIGFLFFSCKNNRFFVIGW